jgi:hypothetical protein
MSQIRFEKRNRVDERTNRKMDEVAVIRDGREVAVLPEADRVDRAMGLSLDEASWIARNFEEIMHREPSGAEQEFWRAVVDYKRSRTPGVPDNMGTGE